MIRCAVPHRCARAACLLHARGSAEPFGCLGRALGNTRMQGCTMHRPIDSELSSILVCHTLRMVDAARRAMPLGASAFVASNPPIEGVQKRQRCPSAWPSLPIGECHAVTGLETSSVWRAVEVTFETSDETGCRLAVCSRRGEVSDLFVLAFTGRRVPNGGEAVYNLLELPCSAGRRATNGGLRAQHGNALRL